MSRFALVRRVIWLDEKVRHLSPLAKLVWGVLLTHPNGSMIPGFIPESYRGMSELLGFDTAEALDEVIALGMLKYDPDARLFWAPNGVKHQPPANPKVIKGWANQWTNLPPSSLLIEAAPVLVQAAEDRAAESPTPPKWAKSIDALRKTVGFVKPYRLGIDTESIGYRYTHTPTPTPTRDSRFSEPHGRDCLCDLCRAFLPISTRRDPPKPASDPEIDWDPSLAG